MKLVIFDCDGVLVDSEVIFNQALRDSLATHGLDLTLDQCMGHFLGGTIPNVKLMATTMGAKLPNTWVEDFYIEIYDKLRENVEPVAGIFTVLDRLSSAEIPFCVASNGRPEKMDITLGRTGMLDRFDGAIFSAQQLGTAKPAPELFLHAADAFSVSADDCIVIEDSLNGVLAAKRAGMKCYGYVPHGGDENLAAEDAILFDDMTKLPELLGL